MEVALLKIIDVQLTPIAIKRTNGFQSRHVIVQIKTDEGIVGVGEMSDYSHLPAYMPNVADLNRTLSSALLDKNPLHLAQLDQLMLSLFLESDLIYDMSAVIRSGVSIALYDIMGKSHGCSVGALLGGGDKKSVPIAFPIFRQADEAEVQRNLTLVENKRSEGFTAYHVYVGQNPSLEIEFVSELRSRYGSELQISIDGSNLLGWRDSLKIARKLQALDILYYESPALRNDVEGLAEFRRKADVPVSEHVFNMRQAERLLSGDCLDVLNLTVVFAGGIRPAIKLLHAAEVFNKSIVIGTTQELAAGSAAQVHFSSAISNTLYPSHITGPLLYMDDVVSRGLVYENGALLVPDGIGLGIELSEELLKKAQDELVWEVVSVASILHRKG